MKCGRRVICLAFAALVGGAQAQQDIEACRVLIAGLENTASSYSEARFVMQMDETRYVTQEDGSERPEKLNPNNVRYSVKGSKFYVHHTGGGFSGVAEQKTDGVYESAFDSGRLVTLDHLNKTMSVFPEVRQERV